MTPGEGYVGIDVAKSRLDVAVRPANERLSVVNGEAGIAALVAWLQPQQPRLIVLEATGGYERAALVALGAAGLPVVAVNPRQVRDFAKATGRLAKTDRIDAAVLAHFAEAVHPEPRPLPDEETETLRALVARRQQVIEMLTAERNRQKLARPPVAKRIAAHIAVLKEELAELDQEIDQTIHQSPLWRAKEQLLRSVPGIGPTVAATLLADLPELGAVTRHEGAALVGVAPLNRDSGARHGQRVVWGGRAHLRATLYMATLVATRSNPVIRGHYQQLLTRGKAKKVALVACMRKLLTILNAMVRSQTPWRAPDLQKSP